MAGGSKSMRLHGDHTSRIEPRIIYSPYDHDGMAILEFNGLGTGIELLEPMVRGLNMVVLPSTCRAPISHCSCSSVSA